MTDPVMVVARLYEHVEPIDRGERYEDPLDDALKGAGLGTVTGGGSQLGELGEIEFADVEIEVANVDAALPVIIEHLERAGAPVGSELLTEGGAVKVFGAQQSVAVYLDGVSLPDDVYANLDFGVTVDQLTSAAGEGSFHGFWQGAEETGLFFFGPDAEAVWSRLEPVLSAMPIGQNARVVVRPARDAARHRTVRLPRH
jgi:hypothetical protein